MVWMICRGLSGLLVACGRAGILAAAAFGAGEGVEQVFPGEVGYFFYAVAVADGKLFPGLGVGLCQGAEEAVGDGGEDMHMFADGEEDQEGQQHAGVQPPEEPG